MKWSATFPVSWCLSFTPNAFLFPKARLFIRRVRHHLLCDLIPTLLILICISWAALLVSEQIDQAATKPKISFDQLYADR